MSPPPSSTSRALWLLALLLSLSVWLCQGTAVNLFDLVDGKLNLSFSAPKRKIIGNSMFAARNRLNYSRIPEFTPPVRPTSREVRVVLLSAWEGTDFDQERFNHAAFARAHNLDFVHVAVDEEEYTKRLGANPPGWINVDAAHFLLTNYPEIDYVLKVDSDCLFVRTDLRVESILDPYEQFDFYIGEITESRFTQSHAWVVKNSDFGRAFLKEWLSYRFAANCANIAQEQGALHFILATTLKRAYKDLVADMECQYYCHTRRSAYHHHHCVLDWYVDNHFGIDSQFTHPNVYLYEFPGNSLYYSPTDGFSFQIDGQLAGANHYATQHLYPLTIHPCKKNPYLNISSGVTNLKSCY